MKDRAGVETTQHVKKCQRGTQENTLDMLSDVEVSSKAEEDGNNLSNYIGGGLLNEYQPLSFSLSLDFCIDKALLTAEYQYISHC